MTRSRTSRKMRTRVRGTRGALAIAAIIGVSALAVGLFFGIGALTAEEPHPAEPFQAPAEVAPEAQLEPVATATPASAYSIAATGNPAIEVPSVTGKSVQEAEMILTAAGLAMDRRRSDDAEATGLVSMQDPVAGSFVTAGATVVIGVPASAMPDASTSGFVVCIDPGHQSRADLKPEPIGPGSSETKARVTGGTTGVSTRIPECEIALQISMNLKKRLEAAGVRVVMTRTTNDVSISNAERARIANGAGADLFIRVHADGNADRSMSGVSTLYPAVNRWTGPIAEASKRAAGQIHTSTVSATGALSRGMVARSDITGFNYSKVPVVLVECGFLSNPVEDKLLASPHYQDKLAEGMVSGALAFLKESKR